jgi:acyl carrier protein
MAETGISYQEEINELRSILANALDVDEETLSEDSDFSSLGGNSLMALEILVTLEKRYQIKISEEELAQMTSLQNVYGLIKAKQSKI